MSAKKNSPDSKITLLVDDQTRICIEQIPTKKQILNLVDEFISVPRPQNFTGMETSRYLKTKMREFVKGNFLYIDSDTIICESLNEIENTPFDLGAILDQHMNLSQSTHAIVSKDHIKEVSHLDELVNYEKYFNGGVLWVRDVESNHKFFKDWHNNWLQSRSKGIRTDMPALALANYQNNFAIQELDGIWNCQIWFGANYLSKAKIIHYFTSIDSFTGGYSAFSTDLPLKIQSGKQLDELDSQKIQNARNSFPIPNAIIAGADYEIYRSSLCGILRALYRKKKLFSMLERMLLSIRILRAKIMFKRK
jgi:hypothetical protein